VTETKYSQCEIVWQPLDCDFQPTDGSFCKYFMKGQCNPDSIVWEHDKQRKWETFIKVDEVAVKETESK